SAALGPRQQECPAARDPGRLGQALRTVLPLLLRARARAGPPGGGGDVAGLLPHALGQADPGGDRRPRDAGSPRGERGRALYAGVRVRELAGRPRRRAGRADGGGGPGHGQRRADQRLRGRGDRRARQLRRQLHQRGTGGGAAVLRHPDLPGDLDRAAVRPHGGRSHREALGASRPPRGSLMARFGLAAAALLVAAPLLLPPFFLQLLTEIAIAALFATAFNLLM